MNENNSIDDVFQAVRLGDLQSFNFIKENLNINELNEFEQNLLHEAISSKQDIFLSILLQENINVNQRDKNGQTPLHYCGLYKTPELAEKLIQNGSKIDISDNYGNEPLWTAVINAKGNYNVVRVLMKYNSNSRKINNANKSPLDFAKQINDNELISILG